MIEAAPALPPALAGATVFSLFSRAASAAPDAVAIEHEGGEIGYGVLLAEVEALARGLAGLGVRRGDRLAVVSENRPEFLRLILAAAAIGAIVACQNTRLAAPELGHCLGLVAPKLVFVSARCRPLLAPLGDLGAEILDIAAIPAAPASTAAPEPATPEDPLLIIYTSGTTGLPKGAAISHRAEIARMLLVSRDLGFAPERAAMLAWAPMYHIGGTDESLSRLMSGGRVVVVDGFRPAALVAALARRRFGWVLVVPGMIEELLAAIEAEGRGVAGCAAIGCMADLVPPALVERATRLFRAPFLDSFGMTETGLAPLSGGTIPVGVTPGRLVKKPSSLCEFRLIDEAGHDVAPGAVGEGAVRGPTLFSGYWNAPEANAREFVDGWFRMGDLFRAENGGHVFVDRARYLIKSGGENIYPAEIERLLLADPRIAEACVVRRRDARWGEVPVAFVARADEQLSEADVEAICRAGLAAFKRPKEVRFVAAEALPRSTSGKILRGELEKRL